MTRSWLPKLLRRIGAFVVALAAMVLLGSVVQSYLVQRAWSSAAGLAGGTAPVAIPFTDRISWVAHDFVGIFGLYCSLTAVALLVAFLLAGALARFIGYRTIVFAVGGALALFTLFATVRMTVGTVGIFGARGPIGFAGQMIVGAIAGLLFAKLTTRRTPHAFT